MTIAIVDLGISNIGSILRSFEEVGAPPMERATAKLVARAGAIVLPGVGAFGAAMAELHAQDLVAPIRKAAQDGRIVFGVCLGMQLLADTSEEHGLHDGLGLVPGRVVRLPSGAGERVPNIGWCDVVPTRPGKLLREPGGRCFYHVHSYHLLPANPDCIAATTTFGGHEVVVAVEQGNVLGVQFHPEKSQDDGLSLLASFVALAAARSRT